MARKKIYVDLTKWLQRKQGILDPYKFIIQHTELNLGECKNNLLFCIYLFLTFYQKYGLRIKQCHAWKTGKLSLRIQKNITNFLKLFSIPSTGLPNPSLDPTRWHTIILEIDKKVRSLFNGTLLIYKLLTFESPAPNQNIELIYPKQQSQSIRKQKQIYLLSSANNYYLITNLKCLRTPGLLCVDCGIITDDAHNHRKCYLEPMLEKKRNKKRYNVTYAKVHDVLVWEKNVVMYLDFFAVNVWGFSEGKFV